jgi:K+ transporter
MLYGDGAITPAISVLSALEGLKDPLPSFAPTSCPNAARPGDPLVLLSLVRTMRLPSYMLTVKHQG